MYEKAGRHDRHPRPQKRREFYKIYGLDVVVVPTNKPMVRDDLSDLIYKTEEGKWTAVTDEIQEHYKTGRPVLVGTTSIESSEKLSGLLKKKGRPPRGAKTPSTTSEKRT